MPELIVAVLTGILIFVMGQVLQRFILEPLQEQRRTIGEIAFVLVYLANVEGEVTPPETIDEAKTTIRRLAGQLRSTVFTIPRYRLFERLGITPSKAAIYDASTGLIGWSNSLRRGETNVHRDRVSNALKID